MFKKDKGLSPVIAVLLMVAITVVAAAGLYVWYSGMAGSSGATTSKETSGALSGWWKGAEEGLKAAKDLELSFDPSTVELIGPMIEIPEWKPGEEGMWIIPSVTNETFTSLYDQWVQLAHTNIVEGSETVTDTSGATTYTSGTDYEMNYIAGQIKVLSGGNMSNNTDYYIDYEYIIGGSMEYEPGNSAHFEFQFNDTTKDYFKFDGEGGWDSDGNELCGCCDAIGIWVPPRNVMEENDYKLMNTFMHEGEFIVYKATVTNTGTETLEDAKLVIAETPHDNCWWSLHAVETKEGLVWVEPNTEVGALDKQGPEKTLTELMSIEMTGVKPVDTYFGVKEGYMSAKVALGEAYATFANPVDDAGIHYVFNGYKVSHMPLMLDTNHSVNAGPVLGSQYDNLSAYNKVIDDDLGLNDTMVGPGLELVNPATTPTGHDVIAADNGQVPYITYMYKLPYHMAAVVDDADKLSEALSKVNSSWNLTTLVSDNWEGWLTANGYTTTTDEGVKEILEELTDNRLLVDTVALVVNEDEIIAKHSSNVYELGDIEPGESKSTWIVLGNRHFAPEVLDLPSFRDGISYSLPIQVYSGGKLLGETSYTIYFKDTGYMSEAHA
ncbi:archaellin/type IV pilin N-terminal domain-containing protein [Candidatus Alkanophaga liquidiphilum]